MIRGVAPGQGRCAYISPLAWGYSPDGLSWADGGNTDSLPGGRPSGEDTSSFVVGGGVAHRRAVACGIPVIFSSCRHDRIFLCSAAMTAPPHRELSIRRCIATRAASARSAISSPLRRSSGSSSFKASSSSFVSSFVMSPVCHLRHVPKLTHPVNLCHL